MSDDGQTEAPPPARRNIWPWVIIGFLLSFVVGIIGSPWLEARVRSYLPAPLLSEPLAAEDRRVDGLLLRVEDTERSIRDLQASGAPKRTATKADSVASADERSLAARVEALEAALDARQTAIRDIGDDVGRLGEQLRQLRDENNGPADRVEDLFLLSVMRRLVETGRPFGALDPVIAEHFRSRDADAVQSLLVWSNQPQTMRTLAARLEHLRTVTPARQKPSASGSWWSRLRAGMGNLIRSHDPSLLAPTTPEDNFDNAILALRSDDLDYAIASIEKEPPTADVRQWLADARVLRGAGLAINRLESISLTEAVDTAVRMAPEAG